MLVFPTFGPPTTTIFIELGIVSIILMSLRSLFNAIFLETKESNNFTFEIKKLDINGVYLKLEIWDTLSDQEYLSLTKLHLHSLQAAIIVLDLTDRDSLDYAKMFFEEIKANIDIPKSILLGNKAELIHNIHSEDIEELVNKYNAKYFEVSALQNDNIEDAIKYLGDVILKDYITDKCNFKDLICYDDSNAKICNIY